MKKVLYTLVVVLLCSASFAQVKKTTRKRTSAPAKAVQKQPAAAVPSVTADAPSKEMGLDAAAASVKKPKIKTPPKDGYSVRKDIDSNVLVPLADVREEDVYYAKRVWREIDLRDTINSVLNAENSKLIQVLIDAIRNEELTVYSPKDTVQGRLLEDNDSFRIAYTKDQALQSAQGTTEGSPDADGKIAAPTLRRFRPDEFMKYRIKEDWILDIKRSIFEPRIVGIAPMKMVEGNWQPVFWVYFEDARELLNKFRIVNPGNDASTLTFDDFFIRRLFASNVIKETNPSNKTIVEILGQTDPKDPRKLFESEKIKKSISDYEQSLWEY